MAEYVLIRKKDQHFLSNQYFLTSLRTKSD